MKASRRHIWTILRAALAAADPAEAVRRHVRVHRGELRCNGERYSLNGFRRVFVIGAGKATAAMAGAIEDLLGSRVAGGWINVKYSHSAPLKRIHVQECGHPTPDEAGWEGARRIARIAKEAREDDLVICLISGGASALMPLPLEPMTLVSKRGLTQKLLACGADIHEMNTVRKHISGIKGGQLAKLAYPATVLTLILSDVIGDDPSTIGSGPTAPDPTTKACAAAVLRKYGIAAPVDFSETPKPGSAVFRKVRNVLIGSNRLALDAAKKRARELGYRTLVLSSQIEGETREVARMHAAIAREIVATAQPVKPPCCLISGGETTVTIRGQGKGGRNQEFALAAALDIAGLEGVTVASIGTDGTDGPTDAAGAIADGSTVRRARSKGLDAARYLANNDSYHLFAPLQDLVITGPTGTNVMDLRLLLID